MRTKNQIHDTWLTPKAFYDKLNQVYRFDNFDPCPPDCDTALFDGLKVRWADCTFCNPPYAQKSKEAFIHKAYSESLDGKLAVLLVPSSTSTVIFHRLILPNAKVEFIEGRIPFEGIDNQGNWCNPRTGMYSLPNVLEGAPEIKRSGQVDLMLVIFGQDHE
jgi:hypothetical protein